MLQVDLFLSFGFGSGLALASKEKLRKCPSAWVNPYYVTNLLWTSLIFVPTTFFLMLNFTHWETMFIYKNLGEVPTWILVLLGPAQIGLASWGFGWTASRIRKFQDRVAGAIAIAGFAAALFMILFGWDGTGWQRTTYAGSGADWAQGVPIDWTQFLKSEMATVLATLGALFTATYGGIIWVWQRQTP